MKPLTLEETKLKEEMKSNCLKKGQYIDDKAKDKFKMLCHLEDFEFEYWNLQQENQQLKIQISAREEEYRKIKDTLIETENWLRPAILQLMEIAKQDYFWITDQQIDNAKLVLLNFTVMGDRSVKFKKLERGVSDVED